MLAKKEARKKELFDKSQASNDVAELRSINTEMDTLNGEIAELRTMIDGMPDDPVPAPAPAPGPTPSPEPRGIIVPRGQLNVLGTYGLAGAQVTPPAGEQRSLDAIVAITDQTERRSALFALPEYRTAYLKMLQGKRLDETEQRALTTAADSGGAAVPTVTYNKVIEKLRQFSVLFPLISATYIPGNVTLPVANALTAAQWSDQAAEGTIGDDTVAGVSLSGYTLAKYAKISAAAMVMTVDAFEAYIVDQIGQQLAIAVENAILNGLGPAPVAPNKPQPTGILNGLTWDASNSLAYTLANGLGYDDLVDIKSKLRTPYRPFAKWILNSTTEAALEKIKDTQGRPIFSQAPQNGFEPRILNFPYIVDDYMPDNTLLFGALNYYYMNFSQNAMIEASKEAGFTSASIIYRGVLIADGKPALSEAFVKLAGA